MVNLSDILRFKPAFADDQIMGYVHPWVFNFSDIKQGK